MAGKGSDFEINGSVNISAAGANAALREISEGLGDVARKQEALNKSLGGEKKTTLNYKIVVDDSGVKQLVFFEKERLTVLGKANAELERARRLQDGSKTSLQQQVNQAKQARDEMAKYASSAGGIGTKLGTVNAAWATQNQRVQDLQRQLDLVNASNIWQKLAAEYNLKGLASAGRQITELVNVFQSVSIIVGQVIGSVNQLFDALQRLQSIELTFQGIGAGGDVGAVFSESSRIALGLGVSLNTVRDAFQQLSPVILATGGNIGDVSAITESLSSRFVTFGLSADKSRRVMNGVVQAFSKGKLMAEELTQQISEADPAFRTDLAQAIGVSVKELGEMVKAGEVTNQVLLEAIPRMSKSAGLFGKLGKSATDAANGFRNGSVTVEQFRAQLANIEQLALEDLVNPDTGALQPLLASLAELRAVVTDVIVAFAGSEVFETFLDILGQVASQASLIVQVLVKIGSAIASITQPIFGAVNVIDSLGGTLQGVGIISGIVAGIITAKLLVAIGGLAVTGVGGAAINGIKALQAVLAALQGKTLLDLIKTIGANILAFIGLGKATGDATIKTTLATIATQARTAASALLTKQLGLQAAAEALIGKSGPGGAGGAGRGITQGRGVIKGGGGVSSGVYGPTLPPPNDVVKQANAAKEAATQTNKWGKAFQTVVTAIKNAPKNPWIVAGTIIVASTAAVIGFNTATDTAVAGNKTFAETMKRVREEVKNSQKSIDEASKNSRTFDERIKAIDSTAKGLNWTSLFDIGGFAKTVDYSKLIGGAKSYYKTINDETAKAKTAVASYNKESDKTGAIGEKTALRIKTAETAVNTALDITKKKRQELLVAAEKEKGGVSKVTVAQLKAYDQQIRKIEEQKKAIDKLKREARAKGIEIVVDAAIEKATETIGSLQEQAKSLKAQVIVETDPKARAKLQGELNALEAQLKFIQQDPIEFAIEAKFKIDQRALQDAANLGKATLDYLQSAVEKAQALFNLQAGRITGRERDIQTERDALNERLDGEKEIRQENIKDAEDRGKSEAYIKKLKDEDRKADKAARAEIKAKDDELKKLAEQKRQIEITAIQAKLAALPAQQAAERAALKIQQDLVRLETQRTLEKIKQARIEGTTRLKDLSDKARKAEERGDTDAAKKYNDLFNSQIKYLTSLKAEEASQIKSLDLQDQANKFARDALDNKQQAATLDLQAQLAAQGTADAQGKTAAATQATAAAGSNAASNARQLEQLARSAEGYTKAGAAAAGNQADSWDRTKQAAQDANQAAVDGAKAADTGTGNAKDSTRDAATAADTFAGNMETTAGWAQSVATTLTNLDGTQVNVNVNYVGQAGLWTGGPTIGGQTYRINELGQEGFLSSTGTLSAINKPRNALWKAPGKGLVIPAHIMSKLDVPTGRVSTGVRPAAMGSSSNGMSRVVRAIQGALMQTSRPDPGMHEMASVQAHQAQQIGKLSRAVTKLADKDWNVNVGVRNTGSTAYLDALNRRM